MSNGVRIQHEMKQGIRARLAGKPSTSNPYVPGHMEFHRWLRGWETAQLFQFVLKEMGMSVNRGDE